MIPTSTGATKAVAEVLPQLRGILDATSEPLVSIDFNHNPASATIDLAETKVTDQRLVRVVGWYDNEWGFANRMLETPLQMTAQL